MDFTSWFSEPLVKAFGWTVLHSLWQGLVLALILGFLFWLAKNKSASIRYRLGYGFLLLQLAISVFTFGYLYNPVDQSAENPIIINVTGGLSAQQILDQIDLSYWDIFGGLIEDNMDYIVLFWMSGMVFFFFRLLFGLIGLRQLRRSGHKMAEVWEHRLKRISRRMGMNRAVNLMCSAKIDSPMLIGQLRPMILLPIGMVNQLTPSQVEAVLAHELAHLRRYDYWFNLLQLLIEAVFYYHPAIWWMSYRIREEREHCCDDLAVRVCGDDLLYARTLYSLEAMRRPPSLSGHRLAMNFGGTRKQSLLDRINRIISTNYSQSNSMEKFTITGFLLGAVLLLTISTAWNDKGFNFLEDRANEKVQIDTLPNGKTRVRTTYQGQDIETEVVDGEIRSLKINDAVIPEEEFEAYEPMVAEILKRELPAPPAPPSPPSPPSGAPAPPSPPSPPSPNSWSWDSDNDDDIKSIEIRRIDGDKSQIIIVDDEGMTESIILDDVIMDAEDLKELAKLEKLEINLENLDKLENLKELESLENIFWIKGEDGELQFNAGSDGFSFKVIEDALEEFPETLELAFEGLDEGFVMRMSHLDDSLKLVFKSDEFREGWEEAMEGIKMSFNDEEFQANLKRTLEEVETALEEEGVKMNIHINDNHIIHNGEQGNDAYQYLVNQGLIDDGDNLKLELTKEKLVVNGKKQSGKIHQKMLKWYENQTGEKMSSKSSVKVRVSKN